MSIRAALEAKNDEIKEKEKAWKRIKVLAEEKEEAYTTEEFFFPLPNEKASAKKKRQTHFAKGFINRSQHLLSTKAEYVLREGVTRETDNPAMKAFFSRADASGQAINDFVKNQVGPNLAGYGTVFGVVDKPKGIQTNLAEEMAKGLPYTYLIDPLNVRDWEWGEDGELLWFRYVKTDAAPRLDPFTMPSNGAVQYVTWTREQYLVHNENGDLVDGFAHGFGVVPVAIQASFLMDARKTLGKSTFFTTSNLIILANNILSGGNTELFKHFSSLLIMSQFDVDGSQRDLEKDPDTNQKKLTKEFQENADVLLTSDLANPPHYLTKDLAVVDKAREQAQFYFDLAYQNEKSTKSAAPLQQAESGVSKGYDFQDENAMLFAFAQDLESFEKRIATLAARILKVPEDSFSIKYPTDFDTRGFSGAVDLISSLDRISFPSKSGKNIAYKKLVPHLTNNKAEAETIVKEIDATPEEPETPEEKAPKPPFAR